ncbi:MAG: extracellular solute-binding protein [Acidobacteria bacterium]|nr:extracellular solute-binding protein [Acidobacteriota bacterium]
MAQTSAERKRSFRIAVRKYAAFESGIQSQWESFEAEYNTGLKLEIASLDLSYLQETLFTSGGMANGDWDIAFVNTDWASAIENQGIAMDLAPLLSTDPPPDWPEGWSPSLRRLQHVGKKVLGIPYHDGPECMILRRDLFEDDVIRRTFKSQFERELEPPSTWSEFRQLARFFHQPDKNLYGTGFAAYPDGHNTVYDFLLQLWTRGGELIDAEGNLQFCTREAEEALSFYREILTDDSAVHPLCSELDSVRLGERFAAGELAMVINWFGFATAAHTSEDSRVRDRVAIAPIPSGSSGRSTSLNVYWLLSVPSGTVHPDVAWKFLRHVMTPEMDRVTTLSGAIGCRMSTWNDSEVNSRIPFYHRLAVLHETAREIPMRNDWDQIAHKIDRLVTSAITTRIPIRQLLESAQRAEL